MRPLRTLKIIVLLALSAVWQAASLNPDPLPGIGLIALTPFLFVALTEKFTWKEALFWGYVEALFFSSFVTPWLIETFVIYGHLTQAGAIGILVLYSLINCGRFVLFFYFCNAQNRFLPDLTHTLLPGNSQPPFGKLGKANRQALRLTRAIMQNRYVSLVFFWGLAEYLGWQLFPVLAANLIQGNENLIQTASLFGVRALSLFVFLLNLTLVDLVLGLVRRIKPALVNTESLPPVQIPAVLFIVIYLSGVTYGTWARGYWSQKEAEANKVNIGIVQGNSPLAFESVRDIRQALWQILLGMENQTRRLLAEAELMQTPLSLVVWPESAVPFLSYRETAALRSTIEKLQQDHAVPIMLNDVNTEFANQRRQSYNNIWFIEPNGNKQSYQKILLLPFGEYMPLGQYFPGIVEMFPEVSNFTHGSRKTLIRTNFGMILPSLCYELMTPDFTSGYFFDTDRQAGLIVNLTNDAWFGDSVENYQHLTVSKMRAIELRLPVIRSTNSGTSAYINMTGQIIHPTASLKRESRIYRVPIPEKAGSLFAFWGAIPFALFMFLNLLSWGYLYTFRKIQKRRLPQEHV